ncbi:MAG: family 10 glycosylhydrolase [Peptococcaceae bacterium]|nr:family 10 glycosylhydrolase [Peptococcaceae bacterium]
MKKPLSIQDLRAKTSKRTGIRRFLNRKHITTLLACIAFVALSFFISPKIPPGTPTNGLSHPSEFRGVWVASVLNLDYPSQSGLSVEHLKTEALAILDGAQNIGFNAVILQVRPSGDALYPSDLYPWSAYMSETQGVPPSPEFDPLAFWIEEAHKRDMELHAWINPFRVTRDGDESNPASLTDLAANNPAVQNPDWATLYKDGNYYLDPGLPEVRDYIIQGIDEIITHYDVDGIHFDDYFYPNPDFQDDDAYKRYGKDEQGQKQPKEDWRRANVNQLVQAAHETIARTNPRIRFGISPAGIWQNSTSSPLGSQTQGNETHNSHYADCLTWIQNKWIDYICPQLYWEIGYSIADYSILLDWWTQAVKGTPVDLYIGQAAYRTATEKTAGDSWYGTGEIVRQLSLNATYTEVKGHIMFRYGIFTDTPILPAILRDHYLYPETHPPISSAPPITLITLPSPPIPSPGELMIGRPVDAAITASKSEYCLLGASDPQVPLKMNGEEITTRTEEGYFSVYVTLDSGSNSFEFTQEGQDTVTRLITFQKPGSSGSDSSGSGGSPPSPSITPTPDDPRPLAEVSVANAYIFPSPTTTGGPCGELVKGQTDTLIATTDDGKWSQLGIGVWIQNSDIRRLDSRPLTNTLSPPIYVTGDKWDTVSYTMETPAASTLVYDGEKLTLKIRGDTSTDTSTDASNPPSSIPPDASPFDRLDMSAADGITTQVFTLKSGQEIHGYYTDISGTTLTLHIKKKPPIRDTAQPLQNLTILLDPGHGGAEPGALGPLGAKLPEKTINLSISHKVKQELERFGATVEMTRTDDSDVPLGDRVEKNRALRPDLFLSIHANSVEESKDAAQAMGVSTWHKERVSEDFSAFMCQFLWNDMNRPHTGHNQSNFYVCRPTWTPSFIVETGFMCNPKEFSWLINEVEQNRLANSIARGVVAYFQ